MVIANPENIANNVEDIDGVRFLKPFLALTSEKVAADRLAHFFEDSFGIAPRKTREAVHAAWAEQLRAKENVRAEGARALQWMQDNGRPGIVLAGRPYHVDPEINHGIPEMILSLIHI